MLARRVLDLRDVRPQPVDDLPHLRVVREVHDLLGRSGTTFFATAKNTPGARIVTIARPSSLASRAEPSHVGSNLSP